METNRQLAGYWAASVGWERCLYGIILLGISLLLGACTSLSPASDEANTLQEQIRTGQALQQGDRIRVVTQDGVSHKLIVVAVEGDVLKGQLPTSPIDDVTDEPGAQEPKQKEQPLMEIPITDIVLLEKEEFSTVKTAAATGGVLLLFVLLSAAAAFAAVMSA